MGILATGAMLKDVRPFVFLFILSLKKSGTGDQLINGSRFLQEKKEWEKELNGSMYYVTIPHKMNGPLVLLISQSQFLTCIWQLVSVVTLGKCWDT